MYFYRLKLFKLIKNQFLLLFFVFFISKGLFSQTGFEFANSAKKKQTVSFKLINNLIVFPLEVNGKNLSFILDTGVNKTIIFNVSNNDSIALLNVERIQLKGLGDGKPVEAIISKNNSIRVKNIMSNQEVIYVISKDFFDLSSRMGVTIHGIIGFNLLKDFVLKINYKTRKIVFYNRDFFNLKKCRRCEVFPLEFHAKKPFINASVQLDTIGNSLTDVKMLLDSGGTDALWLFENSKENIQTPLRYFNDILGEGLSGPVFGNRSRIPMLKLGSFKIKQPTVSFLDTLATKTARTFKQRNGSIGGAILRRFNVWLDYRNKQIMLKKKSSFGKDFNYNMSGLDVVYNGKQLIRETKINKSKGGYSSKTSDESKTISFVTNYEYKFKPSYKIKSVVKNSPAEKAGLLANDIIIKINRKYTYNFTLNDILYKFQEKENKKIKIVVERDGILKSFQFRLQKKL